MSESQHSSELGNGRTVHMRVWEVVTDPSWDEMMLKHERAEEEAHSQRILSRSGTSCVHISTYVFITRVLQSYNTVIGERPFRLMERSVFGDQVIFVRACTNRNS